MPKLAAFAAPFEARTHAGLPLEYFARLRPDSGGDGLLPALERMPFKGAEDASADRRALAGSRIAPLLIDSHDLAA